MLSGNLVQAPFRRCRRGSGRPYNRAAASPLRSSNGHSSALSREAQQLLSSQNLPGSFRTQPSALGEVHLEDSLGQLRTALSSSACLLQLALTTAISVVAHIIIGWGVLTNWADHEPVQICLFNWAHPAGYSGAPTSIAQSLPFDAFFTALISCLISMKRMGEVQRGFLPHVPSTALRVGPLFMLFPRRGTSVFPRLSTVVSVTFVWTVFWSALALVTLSIVYAAQGSNAMCTQGWNYIAARTAWGTVEAWLVSAGSFVLWCSLADDVTSRSPAERARLRREADDEDARLAAGFFGWFQVSLVIVAFVALGFGIWTWYFAYGGLPNSIWFGTLHVVVCSLLIWFLGIVLSRYHQRDESHAAKTMRPGLLLGVYITLLGATTFTSGTLGAVMLSAVPSAMEFILQNWAWVKTRAIPFSEPGGTATATANNMSRLSIVLIALACVQALTLYNVLIMLSRRGVLALTPFAAHFTTFWLGIVTIGGVLNLGQTACYASPIGCNGAKILMLVALLLALLPFVRLVLAPSRDPIESSVKFAVYLVYIALTAAFCLGSTITLGVAGSGVVASIDNHWDTINLALPDAAFLSSGHRRDLFRSSAETSLGVLATLGSAALLQLLVMLSLSLYTRYATLGELLGTRGGANRVADGPSLEDQDGAGGLGRSKSWWYSASPKRLTRELLLGVEDSDAAPSALGRTCSAPPGFAAPSLPRVLEDRVTPPSSDQYDSLDKYQTRVRGGAAAGSADRLQHQESVLSNVDNDGVGQVLLHNAELFPTWFSSSVPRLPCSLRFLFAGLALAIAYVAGMVYFDSVAGAAVPFKTSARQSLQLSVPFSLNYSLYPPSPNYFANDATILNIVNNFHHGTTQVLLSHGSVAEVQVYLTVDTSHTLTEDVVLSATSCTSIGSSSSSAWPSGGVCYTPPTVSCQSRVPPGPQSSGNACNSAQLNITASPPGSCNERCSWYWLWFPCRCHASANLTIVLPNAAVNANISQLLAAPYTTPLVVSGLGATNNMFQHAFIDLNIASPNGGSVRIAPFDSTPTPLNPGDISDLLGRFAVNNLNVQANGDVVLEQVLAVGAVDVASNVGAAILTDIFGGAGVTASAASITVTDAFIAQPCIFVQPLSQWVGGSACAGMGVPMGERPCIYYNPPCDPNKVAPPFGLVLGALSLTANGDFDGAILMNGTVISASAPMVAAKGIMAFSGARFVGSMQMTFTEDTKKGSAANLNNVAVLDCSVCKPVNLLSQLSWVDLPLSAALPTIFCACQPPETYGILLSANDASMTALLAIGSNITATSVSGALVLDEYVLTSQKPTVNINGTQVGPNAPTPVVNLFSTYGDVQLNGLISTSLTPGAQYNISLQSMAGDVKALFTGGALDGNYEVRTEPGGIGHTGIVIDNQVTKKKSGHVGGAGNASVYLYHDYGELSLSMSTNAPSVFDGITGSLTSGGGSSLFGAGAPATEPDACGAPANRMPTLSALERVPVAQRAFRALTAMAEAEWGVDEQELLRHRRALEAMRSEL